MSIFHPTAKSMMLFLSDNFLLLHTNISDVGFHAGETSTFNLILYWFLEPFNCFLVVFYLSLIICVDLYVFIYGYDMIMASYVFMFVQHKKFR